MGILRWSYAGLRDFERAVRLALARRRLGGGDRFLYTLPWGLKMDLRYKDHIAQRLLLFGTFEPEFSAALFALVEPGMTVVDVGANVGVHTQHMACMVGDAGWVISFEPNPVAREELRRNIALNGLTNVRVMQMALRGQDGEREFCFPVDGQEALGGLLDTSRAKPASRGTVAVGRLGTALSRLGIESVDLIKVDVEGAELQVLWGAGRLLDRRGRPPILFECASINSRFYGYSPAELRAFLIRSGYKVEQLNDDNYLALCDPAASPPR